MKREERKTLNSLKKTVDHKTINIDVPTTYTHEARQSIHEMLTIQKHFTAKRIEWDNILHVYCIAYSSERSQEERQNQENRDIDDVMKDLPQSDYTWNGYKMRTFHDIESDEEVTEAQLFQEYTEAKKAQPDEYNYSFSNYIKNSLTVNNGTLTETTWNDEDMATTEPETEPETLPIPSPGDILFHVGHPAIPAESVTVTRIDQYNDSRRNAVMIEYRDSAGRICADMITAFCTTYPVAFSVW